MEKKAIERKIRKVGNSLAVTIPMEIIEEMGLREGDTFSFEQHSRELILRKKEEIITEDFMKMLKEVTDKNDEAMRRLVDK